jgi:cell division protein FtsB
MIQRIVFLLVLLGGLFFAVQGGEYSTMDLWRQRVRKQTIIAQTDTLTRQVDSLKKVAKAVQTDPATQERIAREEFGMVRGDKEILYRFASGQDTAVPVKR